MSELTTISFRAMSTDVAITIVGGDRHLAEWAQRRIEQLEQLWSRFRADSEISRLNGAEGTTVQVSRETVSAVRAACAAWLFTGGRFDPTVHDSLLRLGYADTIETVRAHGAAAAATPPLPSPGCNGIVIDTVCSTVQLPAHVRLDLGGIGKGLAGDDVAEGLLALGASGAMVNIGGDVRVIGTPSAAAAWRVEIEDPRTHQICAAVELLDGGVASSTTLCRRWISGSTAVHHLIDPRTGVNAADQVAGGSVVGVTVVAGSATWADALSKVPFVDRHEMGACFAAASALIVHDDGTTESVGPLHFLRPVPA